MSDEYGGMSAEEFAAMLQRNTQALIDAGRTDSATRSVTIEEFIEARIADWEEAANEAVELVGMVALGYEAEYQWLRCWINPDSGVTVSQSPHPGAPTPREVLRQCAAIEAILETQKAYANECFPDLSGGIAEGTKMALYELAAIWADHPDYQEGWAI